MQYHYEYSILITVVINDKLFVNRLTLSVDTIFVRRLRQYSVVQPFEPLECSLPAPVHAQTLMTFR